MASAGTVQDGTFLRSFTFGHVRQLDKVTGTVLARAWAAGAGPGEDASMIDLDSTVCEVHGYHKQGAAYGYTRALGLHPLLATRAETGEVLHVRQRKGSANTARGAVRFLSEVVARARRAGATGALTLRADSGFWSERFIGTCRRLGGPSPSPCARSRRSRRPSLRSPRSTGPRSTTPNGVRPSWPRPPTKGTG